MRDSLEKIGARNRVLVRDQDGKERWLSGDDRLKAMEQLRKQIQELCG
jgi:hypothetical protein